MKQRTIILIAMLASVLGVRAQKLTVDKMVAASRDLSASTYERKDLTGKPCGLVKVQLARAGAKFQGNVIGNAAYDTGEYWVYMSEGSYMLNVKHPDFVPLSVNFRDYGINGVKGRTTYILTLLMPQGREEKTQKFIINYSPASAMVIVDSKIHRGQGRVEMDLPIGEHSYTIAEDGYDLVEGTVKLNDSSPREITETLTRTLPSARDVQTSSPSTLSNSAIETITVKGVSFNMVRVEGGTFQMGSDDGDAYDDEKPVHQVTLSSYSIGETEVTQELWEAVMGSNPAEFKGAKHPVENASWDDCQEFIHKLNEATGRSFRLPTEAEWEYAARGGKQSRGFKYAGGNSIDDVAVYDENSYAKGSSSPDYGTHPVKTKKPNELGLYDMSGNVFEWCQDWYVSYNDSAQTNPTDPGSGAERVCRGGSWGSIARNCRSSHRDLSTPSNRYNRLGLRLAF